MDAAWSVPNELPDLRRVDLLAFDTETKDNGISAERGSGWPTRDGYLCGVSVAYRADGEMRAHYLPIRHPDTNNFNPDQLYHWLKDHVASGVRFVTQNGVYDWGWIRAEADIRMPPSDRLEEIGALATIVDENLGRYSLDALCKWRGLPGKDEALLRQGCEALGLIQNRRKKFHPQSHIWQLPARYVGPYTERDAHSTLLLLESLNPILDRENTRSAYRLEVDLLPLVLEMRRRGIRIDMTAAERARDLLLAKRDAALTELSDKLGVPVSMHELDRNRWLAETFDREGIKYPRTAKGNPSFTGGAKGWMLQHPHWLPQLISCANKYDNAGKNMVETYILGHVHRGRVHAEVHPHRNEGDRGTRSFRFSYSSPPLQLMPVHDPELGPLIRGIFLPEEGEVWCKPDASQQEFRFLVHYAAVQNIAKADVAVAKYLEDPDADFHAFTATMTGLDRTSAKNVNFAKSYGAGVKKFAEMIRKPLAEAQAIYAQYDRELPFLNALSERYKTIAYQRGYITLFDGARRHFNQWAPGGKWSKGAGPCSREEAERRLADASHPWFRQGPLYRAEIRLALNALIQGSAARHTKLWMRACWSEGIVPMLQMHDALDTSVSSLAQAERIAELGCSVIKLRVPMRVDLAFGHNWGDATHTWEELHNGSAPTATPPAIEAPRAIDPELQLCAQCGGELSNGQGRELDEDLWLHPECEQAYIKARMQEEGLWTTADKSTPQPPPSAPSAPLEDEDRIDDDGNGAHKAFTGNGTPAPSNRGNGYPHGEDEPPSRTGTVWGPRYIYRDAQGRPYMQVQRCTDSNGKKSFPTAHWKNGIRQPGWPEKSIPYRLPELLAAKPNELVLICEGEKDCETAVRYGFVAATNPGGADQWQPELAQYFKGKQRIVIVEDNDDAGAKHTAMILPALRGVVPTIGVLRFTELKPGGDLTDYFEAGGSKDYLLRRIETALKAKAAQPYVITHMSNIETKPIEWLWPGHLAVGGLELMTGLPELGKSQIQLAYAAAVTTTQPWPDGSPSGRPRNVLLVTAEDQLEDTVRPRAEAAGVDLNRLHVLRAIRRNSREEMFLLSSDLDILEQAIRDLGDMGLILIDPVTAYMGRPSSGKFDSHRATDVRGVLSPFKDLAGRCSVAVSAITHPPKGNKTSALDSFIGSQAYIAAARIAHICVPEIEAGIANAPRKTGRMFYTQIKLNIGPRAGSLAYHIETKTVATDPLSGLPIVAPFIVWEGPVDLTSEEALGLTREVMKRKANPAAEFLLTLLQEAAAPMLAKTVYERGTSQGLSPDQLKRAKKLLGVIGFKRRGENLISPWFWSLPQHVPDDIEKEPEQ